MQERMRSRNFFEYTSPRFKPLTVTDFWPRVPYVNNSRSEAKTEAFTAKPLNGIAMMITATNLEASMDFQS